MATSNHNPYESLTHELFTHANALAALDLEGWLGALEHNETVAAVVDPTLYRKYIYSKKPEALKTVLSAALALKFAVLKVQPLLIEELMKDIARLTAEGPRSPRSLRS